MGIHLLPIADGGDLGCLFPWAVGVGLMAWVNKNSGGLKVSLALK
jgi:hypothetical protein